MQQLEKEVQHLKARGFRENDHTPPVYEIDDCKASRRSCRSAIVERLHLSTHHDYLVPIQIGYIKDTMRDADYIPSAVSLLQHNHQLVTLPTRIRLTVPDLHLIQELHDRLPLLVLPSTQSLHPVRIRLLR